MAKSISEIKQEFEEASEEQLSGLLEMYEKDSRKGVQNLILRVKREQEQFQLEIERLENMKAYEREYNSYSAICGVDEAGRGPFAGPVVAGACILPKDCQILYLNDSKKLNEKKRELLFDEIKEKAVAYGIGIVAPEVIDTKGIAFADFEAMRQAIRNMTEKFGIKPDMLFVDAFVIPEVDTPQKNIVHGDAKSVSIAAASILAKVTRDRMMEQYDSLYPEYGFSVHKGYGTQAHIAALEKYGSCPIHRKTFIKKYI